MATAQDERLEIRISAQEKDAWRDAAARRGFTYRGDPNISEWLRFCARRELKAERRARP